MAQSLDVTPLAVDYTAFENDLQSELSFTVCPVVAGFRDDFLVFRKSAF